MALKDWKKQSGTLFWENRKNGDVLSVEGIAGNFELFLQSDRGNKELGDFKTQSQAVNSAKSYMRSH